MSTKWSATGYPNTLIFRNKDECCPVSLKSTKSHFRDLHLQQTQNLKSIAEYGFGRSEARAHRRSGVLLHTIACADRQPTASAAKACK